MDPGHGEKVVARPRGRRTPCEPAARRVAVEIGSRPRGGEPKEVGTGEPVERERACPGWPPGGRTGTGPKPERSRSVSRSLGRILRRRGLDRSGFIEGEPCKLEMIASRGGPPLGRLGNPSDSREACVRIRTALR